MYEIKDYPKHIKTPKGINKNMQRYRSIYLQCMGQITEKAARFSLYGTTQNIWIPRKHLDEKMNIVKGEHLDYIFQQPIVFNKLGLAFLEVTGNPEQLSLIINEARQSGRVLNSEGE